MVEYEPDKFIVINRKHADLLPHVYGCGLNEALRELKEELKIDNKYYVCNQDEPYAQKVLDVILEGELEKTKKNKITNTQQGPL